VSEVLRTRSAEETVALGHEVATRLGAGTMWLLRGDLGAGKTTLVKGIAAALGAAQEEEVTSPTFTLVHEYRGGAVTVFHLDLYRIESERELMTVGIDDLRAADALMLVEWGEKFPSLVATADGEIAIERAGTEEDERVISLHNLR